METTNTQCNTEGLQIMKYSDGNVKKMFCVVILGLKNVNLNNLSL